MDDRQAFSLRGVRESKGTWLYEERGSCRVPRSPVVSVVRVEL